MSSPKKLAEKPDLDCEESETESIEHLPLGEWLKKVTEGIEKRAQARKPYLEEQREDLQAKLRAFMAKGYRC